VAEQPTTPEQTLDWEEQHRRPAVISAGLGAVLLIGSGLLTTAALSNDFPSVGVIQAIEPALNGQAAPRTNPHIAAAKLLTDRSSQLIAALVLLGIATLLMAYALHYLYVATKARRPQTPVAARWLLITAAPALAILGIVRQIVIHSNAKDFVANASPTEDYVDAVYRGGANSIIGPLSLAAQFAFAAAIVLISLNAMRAGLLSRFMGVLGIIVAVLFVIPLFGGGLPIVQIVWLGLLAAMFSLRWPGGQPPAWLSGQAEPWPTAADVRAQREAAAAHREAQIIKDKPAASEEAAEPVRPQHPSSKKRRKKRRH
jgi:hypothetical protein